MSKKPRCPTCGQVAVAIYRRRGESATFERIPKWCCCDDHGPAPVR